MMEGQQQITINGSVLATKIDPGHPSIENGFGQRSSTSTTNGDQNGYSNGIVTAFRSASTGASMNKPDLDYLAQLLKDKKQLSAFPNVFAHAERLMDEEINRVRVSIFQCEFTHEPLQLPEPVGEVAVRQEKVFVPIKQHPEYNFVGRILGPRGMTAKQLETETGCKIMVRGKGSMRDKKKEETNRGKPNWDHLSEDLHVIIQCEDTPNRAELKIARAVDEVNKLLVPAPEGSDDLKKKQLMELAIINGTFRNSNGGTSAGPANCASPSSTAAALANKGVCSAASLLQLDPRLLGCSTTAGLTGSPLIMPSAAAAASPVMSFQSTNGQASLVAMNNSLAAHALALQLATPAQTAAQLFGASPYSGGLASVTQAASTALDYQQQLLALGHFQQQQQQQQPQLDAAQSQQLSALFQQQQIALSALQQQQLDYGGGGCVVGYGSGTFVGAAGNGLAKAEGANHSSSSSSVGAGGYILSGQRRFVGHSRDNAHPYSGGGGSDRSEHQVLVLNSF
uniref:K Homology domain-containing protein n=1 Tax=Globodera rostochiensis TaxID=31243 RepID=A0A914HAG1_GLORO